MTELEKLEWEAATIESYTDVGVDDTWLICPKCNKRPRTWIFNNGRYAKCCCSTKYKSAIVSAESIISMHKRCNGDVREYDCDALRLAWNKHIEEISWMFVTL